MPSWWFAKADTEQNFTNTTYNEKHTLDFTAPAAGDYLILVAFEAVTDNTSYSVGYRAQLDDTTTIMEGLRETSDTFDKDRDYPNTAVIYLAENLGSGSHFVDVDAYVEGGTGYIRNIKIAVLRLDDWLPTTGMYAYANTDGELSLTTSWQTAQTLTFTPDQAGDYLVLGFGELGTGATNRTGDMRINYDSGAEFLPVAQSEESTVSYIAYESQDNSDRRPWLWGGIVNIPASEKTILLEAMRHGLAGGNVRRRRLIAIRLAAMDSNAQSTEDTTITSTSAVWADKCTLTFTPSSAVDYFIIGGIVIKPDDISYPSHARLNQTQGTGTGVINYTGLDSKDADDPADCIPMVTFEIKNLTAVQQQFKTQWGYAPFVGGGTHYAKGSWILAIAKSAAATYTKTYDADVILKLIATKTYDADVLLRATFTKTYNADTILKLIATKTYDADTILKLIATKTYNADLFLKGTLTKTYDADVLLKALDLTKTYTADLLLVLAQTKTYDADMLLKALGLTTTYDADVLLKALDVLKTYTADLILVLTETKTYDADMLLKLIATKTYDVDAILKLIATQTYQADTILKLIATKTYTADLLLKAIFTKTYTADVILQQVGVITYTKTYTADMLLWAQTAFTRGSSIYSQNNPIFVRN